jgi:hypothetical protein
MSFRNALWAQMMLPVFIVLPWLPLPRRFIAISLACLVFVRKGHDSERLRLHERVHWEQWKELWIVGFLVLYLASFVRGMIVYRSLDKAYLNIPFEREAREAELLVGYQINRRKRFCWREYRDRGASQ